MATNRVQIPWAVETKVEISSQKVVTPVVGATVTVRNRDTNALAPVFAGETGISTIPALQTDENGNIPGWLEEGSYSITVSGGSPAIAPVERSWDASRGDGVGRIAKEAVKTENLAPEAVTVGKLAKEVNERLWETGDLKATARSSAPPGWLMCEGQAVSRTVFSNLFAAIGTTYGIGNGSTTFNVPNGVERVMMGAGFSWRRGQIGGESAVRLTLSQIPAHNHPLSISDAGHLHESVSTPNAPPGGFALWDSTFGSGTKFVSDLSITMPAGGSASWNSWPMSAPYIDKDTQVAKANIFGSIGFEGSGFSHNNLQPFFVGNWMIKT